MCACVFVSVCISVSVSVFVVNVHVMLSCGHVAFILWNPDASTGVLATLLNEMDGVEWTEGVLVVAATNRPDMLDPALLR